MSVNIKSSEEAGQHPQDVQDGLFVRGAGLKQEVEVANETRRSGEQAPQVKERFEKRGIQFFKVGGLGSSNHNMPIFSFSFTGCVMVTNVLPVGPECPAAEGEA